MYLELILLMILYLWARLDNDRIHIHSKLVASAMPRRIFFCLIPACILSIFSERRLLRFSSARCLFSSMRFFCSSVNSDDLFAFLGVESDSFRSCITESIGAVWSKVGAPHAIEVSDESILAEDDCDSCDMSGESKKSPGKSSTIFSYV